MHLVYPTENNLTGETEANGTDLVSLCSELLPHDNTIPLWSNHSACILLRYGNVQALIQDNRDRCLM